MGAVAKHDTGNISVLATELLAIKTGREFLLECYLFQLIVESDCLEAVSLVNSHGVSFDAEGIHVFEIQRLFVHLNVTEVSYRSREGNRGSLNC